MPDEPTDISQLPLVPKYAFSDKLGIENLIYETINYSSSSDFSSFASYRQKLGERLDFLAQLSAVDGALVLSPNLEVVTFGSTLNGISQWGGSILAGQDGFGGGGEPLDFSKYGTRHNAALGFVASCPGSIAFVISQDGPIRTFIMKDANTVICWLDTMTSMFI